VFDNAVTAETGLRFSVLEAAFPPSTIGYLTGVGVTAGWACWEIGASGGSIARWLAERVGPTGSVLATDIDHPHVSGQPAPAGVSMGPAEISRARNRAGSV
jgi:hypothetical protein